MCKKTKGILKFFVLCGIAIAAAAAVFAVINKCRSKHSPCCDDADDCDCGSGDGCCDGGCDECELCDLDDDADEEVESVEAAPQSEDAEAENK